MPRAFFARGLLKANTIIPAVKINIICYIYGTTLVPGALSCSSLTSKSTAEVPVEFERVSLLELE